MSVDNTTIWEIKYALDGINESLAGIDNSLRSIEGHLSWQATINENIGNLVDAVEKLAPPVGKPGEVIQGQWGPGGPPPLKVSTDQQPYRPHHQVFPGFEGERHLIGCTNPRECHCEGRI